MARRGVSQIQKQASQFAERGEFGDAYTFVELMTNYSKLFPGFAFAVVALLLITFAAPAAQPVTPKPLPAPVQSQAPGIRPLGRGRQTLWGIRVYDATLWVVGDRFTPAQPHALDVEPSESFSADTLINHAMGEMRRLNLGDASQLASWLLEMRRLIPNVKSGDQIVVFCPSEAKTLAYYNGRIQGEVDDPTLCLAIVNVWLHPARESQVLRKSLLTH
jgi:Chalcone isomerase-like